MVFVLSINAKTFCFYAKKCLKNLEGRKKVLTFASAFAQKLGRRHTDKRVL